MAFIGAFFFRFPLTAGRVSAYCVRHPRPGTSRFESGNVTSCCAAEETRLEETASKGSSGGKQNTNWGVKEHGSSTQEGHAEEGAAEEGHAEEGHS